MGISTTMPPLNFPTRPRPLPQICLETFRNLLAGLTITQGHPVEHAVLAADLDRHTALLAIMRPERFAVVRHSDSVESGGVTYPIIGLLTSSHDLQLRCEDREWVGLFTPDGRALRTELKVKDEVVFLRDELVRWLVEARREERKRAREERKRVEAEKSRCAAGRVPYESTDGDESVEENVRARQRRRQREKDRRQRARKREEAEKAEELKQLEREVIQEGVTVEELNRGFQVVRVGSEVYFDALAEAKKLGLKVVRL